MSDTTTNEDIDIDITIMEIGILVALIALVILMSGAIPLDDLIIGIGVAGLGTSSVGFILALVQ